MKKQVYLKHIGALLIAALLLSSCYKEVFIEAGEGLDSWTTSTHSGQTSPNYDIVFNQNKVNKLEIIISADEYEIMQDNLEDILGEVTTNAGGGGGPGGCAGGGGGEQTFSEETPTYVPADVFFNGVQWYEVGLRYKGNSSLSSSYSQGIGKLPLRLKFDYFDDEYPEITNQKFYGFQDLSLSSNYNDQSFMREKAASDLFAEFGVPSARSSFYEVYLDYGSGPQYMGLYTMVEVVFDTMLEDIFGSNTGNCYKPDGDGAKFGASDFNIDDFEKKTNENRNRDDIQEMYDALHASTRTTDVAIWKANLQSVFDVHGFLKYLAANNTIQNWDTYGNMTHNYFLYHDPADGLLKWVVWDNNEAFQNAGKDGPLSFEMSEVSDEWPLISYLLDISEYRERYDIYVQEFIEGVFLPSKMTSQYSSYDGLISGSATSEETGYTFLSNSSDYSTAVSTIKSHCSDRKSAAEAYLN